MPIQAKKILLTGGKKNLSTMLGQACDFTQQWLKVNLAACCSVRKVKILYARKVKILYAVGQSLQSALRPSCPAYLKAVMGYNPRTCSMMLTWVFSACAGAGGWGMLGNGPSKAHCHRCVDSFSVLR